VILAMYLGNAVLNSSRTLSTSSVPGVPFFTLRDGMLVRDAPPVGINAQRKALRDRLADIENASRLILMSKEALLATKDKLSAWRAEHPNGATPTIPRGYMGTWPYLPPTHPSMREAWKVSEKLIEAIRDEAVTHGAEFWIVTLDMPMQVHPDPNAREEFRRRIGAADLFYPDKRIAELASRESIPIVEMAPDLQRYAETHHVYLHGFFNTPLNTGHWNETGNRVAGELLASRLCEGSKLIHSK
jgi:hypothetical protein